MKRDVCLLLNVMELHGTRLVMLKSCKKKKMLLKIIHKPCFQQFHAGTIFSINVQKELLMDEMLAY